MPTVNLTPLLDSLTGSGATRATFRAVARRAGRAATRVDGAVVTFPTELTAVWDGTGWDVPPALFLLPVDCYWDIRVAAAGTRIEGAYVLPSAAETVAFGDLIAVTPDSGQPDTTAVAQYAAVQQFVSNQVTQVTATAATVFNTVATVQAQIGTSAQQVQQASSVLALVQTAQAAIDSDVTAVITAATQTGLDRTAVATDRTAAETARTAAETAQAAAEAALAAIQTSTTIDGNA